MLRSRYSFAYLECLAAFSEECIANLVHAPSVATLLSIASSALERYILVAARMRREMQGSADAAINFIDLDFWH